MIDLVAFRPPHTPYFYYNLFSEIVVKLQRMGMFLEAHASC